jgi:hypothetical protein
MHQIAVTHGFVKKLARNIRDRYGREVRHTEVIELVADALGFKAGPLMHMLKSEAADVVSTERPERPPGPHYLHDDYKIVTSNSDLTEVQKKLVALVAPEYGSPAFLLIAYGYEQSPDVASAKTHLRRKGYHWFAAPSVDANAIAYAYGKSSHPTPALNSANLRTGTATTSAVASLLEAIRRNDTGLLASFIPLLSPASPVAKFVLAYGHRLQHGSDTRTVMALLLDAFVEEPFFVELAATSVVRDAITDDGFRRFEQLFDYGPTLRAEILAGMFPRKMLAWAASHAVAHGFLRFDDDRAIVTAPEVHPRKYGYALNTRTPVGALNADGKVYMGRETFLIHLCTLEIDGFARMMNQYWTPPNEFDIAGAIARVVDQFEKEAVVEGPWALDKVTDYAERTLLRLLAAKIDKPY